MATVKVPLKVLTDSGKGTLVYKYVYDEQKTGLDKKVYVEERSEGTNRKTHGAFVERTHFGEYVIYDEPAFPDEFTHVIRAIDADNYLVGVHYPQGQITPILRISRGSGKSLWNIKSCHILGRVCLPSPEVYIEETPYSEGRMIKSAVDSPDIKAGEVYNFVTPLGSFDEFTDIISFCAAFLFKQMTFFLTCLFLLKEGNFCEIV